MPSLVKRSGVSEMTLAGVDGVAVGLVAGYVHLRTVNRMSNSVPLLAPFLVINCKRDCLIHTKLVVDCRALHGSCVADADDVVGDCFIWLAGVEVVWVDR